MKPRQKKSRTYYYFWGAATLSVIIGQFYVGNGFRRMAESNDAISADINLLVEVLTYTGSPRGRYEPLVPSSPESTTKYMIHDNLEGETSTSPISGGSPDNKVFCGVIFEGGSSRP